MPIATAAPPSGGLLLLTFLGGAVLAALILVPLLLRASRRSSAQPAPKHARTRPRIAPPEPSTGSTAVDAMTTSGRDSPSSTAAPPVPAKSSASAAEGTNKANEDGQPKSGKQAGGKAHSAGEVHASSEETTNAEGARTQADQQRDAGVAGRPDETDTGYVVVAPVVSDEFRRHQSAKFNRIRTRIDRAQAEMANSGSPGGATRSDTPSESLSANSAESQPAGSPSSDSPSEAPEQRPGDQSNGAGSDTGTTDTDQSGTDRSAVGS